MGSGLAGGSGSDSGSLTVVVIAASPPPLGSPPQPPTPPPLLSSPRNTSQRQGVLVVVVLVTTSFKSLQASSLGPIRSTPGNSSVCLQRGLPLFTTALLKSTRVLERIGKTNESLYKSLLPTPAIVWNYLVNRNTWTAT